ncbi:MAG: S41 family peptidase [Lachnospiraceae bacterium]|nr:S41 family peptidase [Lachnospiraceae bacterium]
MDTQSNQSQELDSQEQLAQEYASREQDYGKRRKSSKRGEGPGFGMGIAAGMSIMLLLVLLVMTGSQLLLNQGKKAAAKQNTAQKAPTKQALSEKGVEKKAAELADLIDQYYYEDIDQKSLIEGMYAGMVEGLDDPYSSYFTAEEYASFNESTTGIYYGIGTVLTQSMDTKIVKILHVYPGTPAEEAGIRDGDVIVKVEDIEADSVELSELTSHIKGEEGTKVHLELIRAGESEHLQVDVERRQIEVPTVEYQMLEGNVGLIQITEFSTATPEQFDHAVKDLQEKGMASMIVDLRNNPGGVLQSVCTMLDEILPEGLLVYTEDKYGSRSNYKSDKNCMNIPMTVLINENSASASEIFAGAIKDYKYGTLIGTTTFGKGIVQSIIPLEDGSALKITMAKYFTPNGNYIHDKGIEPDIELEYEYQSQEDEVYNPMHDNQVLKALEVLKEAE